MSSRFPFAKWFSRSNSKPSPLATRRRRPLWFEQLEDRSLLAVRVGIPALLDAPAWKDLGPTSVIGGTLGTDGVLGNQQNATVGAVSALAAAPDPTFPNTAFAATVNGGVWQTNDINRTVDVDVNQISNPSLAAAPDARAMTANGGAGRVLAANTTTAPANTVVYKVTFVDRFGAESNASLPVAFPRADSILLRNIPQGSTFGAPMEGFSVVTRRIYRLVPGDQDTPAYYGLVGAIGNPLGESLTDSPSRTPLRSTARFERVPSPQWVPKTDQFGSLSISALTVDPDASLSSRYVVYAGTGNASSSHQGTANGLLVSSDGGRTWALITNDSLSGRTITGIQVLAHQGTARTIVVSTEGGLFLVTVPNIRVPSNATASIARPASPGAMSDANISDLASVSDVVAGIGLNATGTVLFAALTPGAATADDVPGIYRSTDGGNNWSLVSAGMNTYLADATRIRFAVYSDAAGKRFALYAGVIRPKENREAFDGLLRYDNLANSNGAPRLTKVTADVLTTDVSPGKQAQTHFSIVVDPSDPKSVYIGGDRTGQIYRVDANPFPAKFTDVTGLNAPGSGPAPGLVAVQGTAKISGRIFAANATYQYAISFVDSAGEESARSLPVSLKIAGVLGQGGADSVELSQLTAGVPANARSIKIFRTKANGSTFHLLETVAANVAKIMDTTGDSGLGVSDGAGAGFNPALLFKPVFSTLTSSPRGTGLATSANYKYALVFVAPGGQRTRPEEYTQNTDGATVGWTIDLSAWKADKDPGHFLVYRTGANDEIFRLVGVVDSAKKSFDDTTPDSKRGPALSAAGTTPHPDSRALVFIGGKLVEADDGGIFQLTNPNRSVALSSPYWQSLAGDLGNLEPYSAVYDPLGDVVLAGNQDSGSIVQSAPGATTWTNVNGGDGASQAVAVLAANTTAQAVHRYSQGNNFNYILRATESPDLTVGPGEYIKLAAASTPDSRRSGLNDEDQKFDGFSTIPIAVNAVNGQLLLGFNGVYTTSRNGDLVDQVIAPPASETTPNTARVTALAYGGFTTFGTPAPNVIYAARGSTIYVRQGSDAKFDRAFSVATKITSFTLDPRNWRVAYAAGGGSVYATVNGGVSWTNITGTLAPFSAGLDTVQLVKLDNSSPGFPNGQDALLVGGANGVFVAYNPLGVRDNTNAYQRLPADQQPPFPRVAWSAFNGSEAHVLPNVLVTQISYTPKTQLNVAGVLNTVRGDVLVISTLGRGVYEIENASTLLGRRNVLAISGDTPDSSVRIAPDTNNPQLIDIVISAPTFAGGPVTLTYETRLFSDILVSGLGDRSTLTIDASLSILGDITFDGGGSSKLVFVYPPSAIVATHGEQTTISQPNGQLVVTYTHPAGFVNQPPRPTDAVIARRGVVALGGTRSPILQPSVGPVENLFATEGPLPIADEGDEGEGGDASETALAGSADPGLFARLLEDSSSGLDLDTIDTFAQLEQYLLGLSDPTSPGSFSQDPVTGEYDLVVNRTLDGTAELGAEALGGTVSLHGSVDVSALVHLHLVFGIDDQGFFLDTAKLRNGSPLLTVDHLIVSADPDLAASGDFGIFEVTATDLTLALDPRLGVAVALPAESLNTLTGEIGERLRAADFFLVADLASVSLLAGPGQTASLSVNLSIDSGFFGSVVPDSLKNLPLTFTFKNLRDPGDVTVSGPGFASISDLIKKSQKDILDGLHQLATFGHQLDVSPGMNTTLPVIDRSLGSYVQAGDIFDVGLYQPVKAYFASLDVSKELPTVGGLLSAVRGGAGPRGDLSVSLAPGLDLSVEDGALQLSYAFTATRVDPIALDVGVGGKSPLSLNANLAVNLQTQFSFDASIGVDLAKVVANPTDTDAFFIKLNKAPTITASFLDGGKGLSLNANIGALQVGGQVLGPAVNPADPDSPRLALLQASVSVGLAHDNATKRTTLTKLLNTPASQLIEPTIDGRLALDIPVTASLALSGGRTFDFAAGGKPELFIQTDHLFTTAPTITTKNFDNLLSFRNLSASALLVSLNQFSSYLGQFADSPAFTQPIPFAKGKTLGSVVNLVTSYANELAGLTAPSGSPAFSSVQELQLANDAIGTDPIRFNFDPAFVTSTGAKVPALTLTFTVADSFGGSANGVLRGNHLNIALDETTPLAKLNGGKGVLFSVTHGADLSIALSDGTVFAVTFDPATTRTIADVIAQINDAPENNGKLVASLNPGMNGLTLTDMTLGSGLFNLLGVQGSRAALDLGLVGSGFRDQVLDPTTPLSHLNNAAGVSFATGGGPDLLVTLADGTRLPITFANATTIADLIGQVAATPGNGGKLTLGFNAIRGGLALFDATTGAGRLTVQAVDGSKTATDLGLVGSAPGVIDGQDLNPRLLKLTGENLYPAADRSDLLVNLNAGSGVSFQGDTGDDLQIRLGDGTVVNVGVGSATTVGGVIDTLNAASTKVFAALGRTGLVLTDKTGAHTAPFTVASLNGSTAAADLGIEQAPISAPVDFGFDLGGLASFSTNSNLFVQADVYASFTLGILLRPLSQSVMLKSSTLLSTLQSGEGIKFATNGSTDLRVAMRDGTSVDVSLHGSRTIGDVLAKLNAASTGKLTAAIGASGLGLVLTDRTAGVSAFRVTALNGSLAPAGLGILGDADINGAIEGTDLSGVGLGDNVFLQNAALTTAIHVGASAVNASASFGFLGVQVKDGFASATAKATFKLGDLQGASPHGYSTVTDLRNALGNVALSVVAAKPRPADADAGIVYGTSTFQIKVGGGAVYKVTVQKRAVANPVTFADLVANLNDSLKTAKDASGNAFNLSGQVRALNQGGSVAFTLKGGVAQTLAVGSADFLGFKGTQTSYVVRPAVNLATDVSLPVVLGSTFSGLNPADRRTGITVKTPAGGVPFDLDFNTLRETPFSQYVTVDLGQLNNLSGFNFRTFVNALDLGLNFLNDTVAGAKNLAFLGEKIPLVNVSLREILGYVVSYSRFVTRLVDDPAGSLQTLAGKIQALLGPAAKVGLGIETSVTGTKLAPLNGVLGGSATFQLVLDGGSPVTVHVPADATNRNLADLVRDINAALRSAGLADKVAAETRGGYLGFKTTGAAPASSIKIQGIPAGDRAATVLGFSNGQVSDEALRFDLSYVIASYANTFAPSLSLSDGKPISFSASTALGLNASATFQLALGIGLSSTHKFTPFLYDYNAVTQQGTGLVLRASASANPLNAEANLGPIGVKVKNGFAVINDDGTGSSVKAATVALGLKSPVAGPPPSGLAGRHTLTDPILSDFEVSQVHARIGASLPVHFGSSATPLLTLGLTANLTDPLHPAITPSPATIGQDIQNALSKVSITQALGGLSAGFDSVFVPVLNGIKRQVLSSNLPLIGPGIAAAADFLLDLKSGFDAALTATTDTVSKIETAIYNEFGPRGLNWLQPIPGDTKTGPAHYLVAQSFPGGEHGAGVQFYVHLKQNLAAVQVPLSADLGVPGLGLKVKGSAYLSLGWDLQLGFGLNTSEGFYVNSSKSDAASNPFPTKFDISAKVTLADPATRQPLSVTGNLGYLNITATDDVQKPTRFQGGFAITLADPGAGTEADQHLTFAKFAAAGFSKVVSAGFIADAKVNLDLSTRFADTDGTLPKLRTIFRLDWPFHATTTDGIKTAVPKITFDQVQINLGSFLDRFARPILDNVKQILAPIQPVIDALTKRLPVISDLEGRDITLIDLVQLFSPATSKAADFLRAVVRLNDLINSIPAAGSESSSWIDLGSFTVSGAAAKNAAMANKLKPELLSDKTLAKFKEESEKQEKAKAGGFMAGVTSLNSVAGGGIAFPILSDPLNAFQVLLGNDGGATPPSLFELTLPTLTLGLKYTQSFPIFWPLSAQLSGEISAKFQFAFGYDTTGLSRYRAESRLSNVVDPLVLFDGFYIKDGPTDNQVVLNAGIAASAVLDPGGGVVTAGVTGGLYANVRFHLHNDDPDPRLRFSAIADQILTNPLGLFDVSGDFTAKLSAFIQIYYVLDTWRYEKTLAEATLLSFNTAPPAGPARDVLSLNAAPAVTEFGQTLTVTATVRPAFNAGSAPVPQGTVQFFDITNFASLGAPITLSATGTATLSVPDLQPGSHKIYALYTPSNAYRPNVSTLAQVVTAASTTTTVGAAAARPVYGEPVSVTATVAALGAVAPTGTVQFFVDGTATGSPVAVSTAQGATTARLNLTDPLTAGVHKISAVFSSSNAAYFSGSSTDKPFSLRIAPAATSTALSASSPNPSYFGQPLVFQVSALAPGAGVPSGLVEFTDAVTGADLGRAVVDDNGVATMPRPPLNVGSYSITATYIGDGNFDASTIAAPVLQTVQPAVTRTVVAGATAQVVGHTATMTATVQTLTPVQGRRTGSVQFQVDDLPYGEPLPIDQLGNATIAIEGLTLGVHTVKAVFADAAGNFLGSMGTLVGNLTIVSKIASIPVAVLPQEGVKNGSTITLVATIGRVAHPISELPTGLVTFIDNTSNTILGTTLVIDALGRASYTVNLAPGPHSILALYSGDSNYLPGTSAPATLSILSPTVVTTAQDVSSDPNQTSLRQAVSYADNHPGSTITFLPSLAGQTLSLTSPLPALSADMTITGLGASQLTLTGNGFGSLFVVNAGVTATISGLTITGGGTVPGFRVVSGAGVANAGNLTLVGDVVTGNKTTLSGGGAYNSGTLTVLDSTFSDNSAAWGAGIANAGVLFVDRSTFSGNTAVGNNGSNGAALTGGGGGGAGLGGAIFNSSTGAVTLTNTTIADNVAQGGSGARGFQPLADNHGGTSGDGSTARDGAAGSFGGGGAGGDTNAYVGAGLPGGAGGFGAGGGGGGGRPTPFGVAGAGGAGGFGGSAGQPGTSAFGGDGGAGAGIGAGVFNNGGAVTIAASTIARNQAVGGVTGGAGATPGQGIGGGVFSLGGTVRLDSTIIASNTATDLKPDLAGTFASDGFNLVGNTAGGSGFVATDLLNVDPLLGALQSSGGPTMTLALLDGSPALDHGDDANGVRIDQRGAQRGAAGIYAGAHADIGAYEASSSYLVTSAADTAAVGSLRAGVSWAGSNHNPINPPTTTNFIRFDTAGAFATPGTLGLTMIGDTTAGPTALAISGDVEIDGPVLDHGGLTIARDASAPAMRLFYVAPGASLTIQDLTIRGGIAQGQDGADGLDGANGTNGADGQGGAVFNRGNLTLLRTTLMGNQAIGGPGGAGSGAGGAGGNGSGGAVFNDAGTMSITNSTLTANTATGGAGGAVPGAGLAGEAGRGLGGAVFNRSGTATLLNATLANNNADAGGALFNLGDFNPSGDPATVHLTNSILAGTSNSATDFDSATLAGGSVFTNGGYNLIQNNPDLGGYVSSPFAPLFTGLDPLLAPLADNGGPTPTMALLPGSAALDDAFASAAPATDQRGVRRVNTGSRIDLGAFEDPLL